MFSKKIQYGLRFLFLLDGETEFKGVSDCSERGNMPLKFVEAIASALRKAGVIDVRRGANGGYRLARPLEQISLGQVIEALNEPSIPLPEASTELSEMVVHRFLNRVSERQSDFYNLIYLSQLQALRTEEQTKTMYYI